MSSITKKLHTPSPALAEILEYAGSKYSKGVTRAEATRAIWVYIKDHDLQDPDDRRFINGDKTLAPIIGKGLSMFQLGGALNKHLKAK